MKDSRFSLGATPRSRRFMLETMLGTGAALAMPDVQAYAATLGNTNLSNAALLAGGVKLKNPYMQSVAKDALDQLKYAFTATAAGIPGGGNAFADSCRRYITSRKPARQASLRAIATQTLARPANVRTAMFGKYAATDAPTFMATDSHVMALRAGIAPRPANFSVDTTPPDQDDDNFQFDPDGFLSDAEIKAKEEKEKHDAQLAADRAAGEKYTHLEFRCYEVWIKEGTGDAGDTEEIALGGNIIGATGNIRKIKQFLVADDFDTDEDDRQHKKYYNINGWHLGWFDVVQNRSFPRYYTGQLAMAELDDGGFGDFLQKLWDKVRSLVVGLIDDALASVLGPIGYAIGEVIGAFIDWLVGLFHNDDDIVGVHHPRIKLTSHKKSHYQKLGLLDGEGHTQTLDYNDVGWYKVKVGWKLMTDDAYNDRVKTIKQHKHMYDAAEQAAQ